MNAQRTYRHFIAAFLLAVYAFIATPVQLWHHHHGNTASKPAVVSASEKAAQVVQGTSASLEKDCSICSHKYAAYDEGIARPFEISLQLFSSRNSRYLAKHITTATATLPNKGPPAFA